MIHVLVHTQTHTNNMRCASANRTLRTTTMRHPHGHALRGTKDRQYWADTTQNRIHKTVCYRMQTILV